MSDNHIIEGSELFWGGKIELYYCFYGRNQLDVFLETPFFTLHFLPDELNKIATHILAAYDGETGAFTTEPAPWSDKTTFAFTPVEHLIEVKVVTEATDQCRTESVSIPRAELKRVAESLTRLENKYQKQNLREE